MLYFLNVTDIKIIEEIYSHCLKLKYIYMFLIFYYLFIYLFLFIKNIYLYIYLFILLLFIYLFNILLFILLLLSSLVENIKILIYFYFIYCF